MDRMNKITSLLVHSDNPASLASRARRRRWDKLSETFPEIEQMNVLDLGGTPAYWRTAPVNPARVTTVNLAPLEGFGTVTAVQGDACNPPRNVTEGKYDLVVSNSLIEHVGGHYQRKRLSEVIHEAADRHWIQTPYRYFPIEPHWLAPGIQFLPFEAKVRATMWWKLGYLHTTDRDTAIATVNEIELLGLTQMRYYFPSSHVWSERAAGLVKSMVAIRT